MSQIVTYLCLPSICFCHELRPYTNNDTGCYGSSD